MNSAKKYKPVVVITWQEDPDGVEIRLPGVVDCGERAEAAIDVILKHLGEDIKGDLVVPRITKAKLEAWAAPYQVSGKLFTYESEINELLAAKRAEQANKPGRKRKSLQYWVLIGTDREGNEIYELKAPVEKLSKLLTGKVFSKRVDFILGSEVQCHCKGYQNAKGLDEMVCTALSVTSDPNPVELNGSVENASKLGDTVAGERKAKGKKDDGNGSTRLVRKDSPPPGRDGWTWKALPELSKHFKYVRRDEYEGWHCYYVEVECDSGDKRVTGVMQDQKLSWLSEERNRWEFTGRVAKAQKIEYALIAIFGLTDTADESAPPASPGDAGAATQDESDKKQEVPERVAEGILKALKPMNEVKLLMDREAKDTESAALEALEPPEPPKPPEADENLPVKDWGKYYIFQVSGWDDIKCWKVTGRNKDIEVSLAKYQAAFRQFLKAEYKASVGNLTFNIGKNRGGRVVYVNVKKGNRAKNERQ